MLLLRQRTLEATHVLVRTHSAMRHSSVAPLQVGSVAVVVKFDIITELFRRYFV